MIEQAAAPLSPQLRERALGAMAACRPARARSWLRLAAAGVGAGALVIGASWLVLSSPQRMVIPPRAKILRLAHATGWHGKELIKPGVAAVVDPLLVSDVSSFIAGWWPDGHSIIYATDRDGSFGRQPRVVWRMNLESRDKQSLVDQVGGSIGRPQVSPTGDHILYMDGRHLRILEVASGENRVVPNSFCGFEGCWSPDGERVAFARSQWNDEYRGDATEKRGLWLWAVAGGEPTKIVEFPKGVRLPDEGTILTPRWSPDGRWIAYVWGKTERAPQGGGTTTFARICEIWLVRPNGTDLHRVIAVRCCPDTTTLSQQCWSPDSKHLVFAWSEAVGEARAIRDSAGYYGPPDDAYVNQGVTILDVETGEITALVPPETFGPWDKRTVWGAAWSPDGGQVAFTVVRRNSLTPPRGWEWEIWVASAEDGATTVAVPAATKVQLGVPVWSPGGRSLLYRKTVLQEGAPLRLSTELWVVELGDAADQAAKP